MKFNTLAQEIAIIFLFLCMVTTASAQSWEFDTPQDTQGWVAYNAGTINEVTNVQNDGLFIIDPTGPDPRIEIHGISLDVTTANNLDFRMSSNCPDNIGAIYFETAESPGFSEDKKVDYTVITGPEWHEYTIQMSGNAFWKGVVTGLRIDPADYGNPSEDDENDAFGFDYIRVISDETENPIDNSGGNNQIIYNFDSNNGDTNLGHNGNSPWGVPINTLPEYNGYHLPAKEGYISYESQYVLVDDSVNPQNLDPTSGNGYYINTLPPDKGHWYWDGRWYGDLLPNGNGEGWYPGAADHVGKNGINMPSGNGLKLRIYAPWSGKTVIAIVGENGPAPWTGRQFGVSNKVFEGLGLPDNHKGFDRRNPNPGHAPDENANPADYPVIKYDDNPYWVEVSWADQSLAAGPVTSGSSPEPIPTETPTLELTPEPVVTSNTLMNVPLYLQTDSKWSSNQLGTCSSTIGLEGCAITSIAMVFKYYGIQTNPADMNYFLKQKNNWGYNKGCLVKWDVASQRTGGVVEWVDDYPTDLDQIRTELNNRHPVIAEVSMKLKSGEYAQHFVVITGYSGSDFNVNDPLNGVTTFNQHYGNPATGIKGIRLYYGIIPLSGNMSGTGEETGTFNPKTSKFTFGSKTVQFGLNTDIPVIGDWDGDGKDEIGVFRPIDDDGISRFYLITRDWDDLPDKAEDADKRIYFGPYPTNIPIAGDWDGDGYDDIGGFNPENNVFYLYKLDLDKPSVDSYKDVPFGITSDIPFIGDWNGDGKDEIGVFRYPYPNNPNTNAFYFNRDLTGVQHDFGVIGPDGKLQPYAYGKVGDYPLIGDWDGDGDDDIGVYRPSTQKFYDDSTIPIITNTKANINDENANLGVIINIIEKYGSKEEELKYDSNVDLNKDGIINFHDFTEYFKDIIMNIFK